MEITQGLCSKELQTLWRHYPILEPANNFLHLQCGHHQLHPSCSTWQCQPQFEPLRGNRRALTSS